MHLLNFLALAAACSFISALPNAGDNAYPMFPGDVDAAHYIAPEPTVTKPPCTETIPPPPPPTTTTPCPESLPTDTNPVGADAGNESRPVLTCPPPHTVTLPPIVITATRTIHDVETATVTSTVTDTTTEIRPVVHYHTVVKPVYHTVTKTKTRTRSKTTTILDVRTIVHTQTVVHEDVVTVTTTVGALPTHETPCHDCGDIGTVSEAPAYGNVHPYVAPTSAYGPVAPASAYGPVAPYGAVSPASDTNYSTPLNLPVAGQDSAYGLQ